jgi:hypothetical protein
MYAELVIITVGPEMRTLAVKVADELTPIYSAMKGFKGVVFIGDVATGEYGSLSLWETREDAEALSGTVKRELARTIGHITKKGPSTRRIFEVYGPVF